jgi:hypothetical protein
MFELYFSLIKKALPMHVDIINYKLNVGDEEIG